MKFYFILMAVFLLPMISHAQEDLIHSDLPIWGFDIDDENVWPQRFFEENDSSFGCVHPLSMGIWNLVYAEDRNDGWIEFANYGVMHCYLLKTVGYSLENLTHREAVPSYLVKLGTADTPRGRRELWILQEGGQPGSDYTLLSREPSEGLIVEFEVLQSVCPRKNIRQSEYGKLDILRTRYCAINKRRTMERFARKMAKLPPIGFLKYDE